jgi:hypothetical protein
MGVRQKRINGVKRRGAKMEDHLRVCERMSYKKILSICEGTSCINERRLLMLRATPTRTSTVLWWYCAGERGRIGENTNTPIKLKSGRSGSHCCAACHLWRLATTPATAGRVPIAALRRHAASRPPAE